MKEVGKAFIASVTATAAAGYSLYWMMIYTILKETDMLGITLCIYICVSVKVLLWLERKEKKRRNVRVDEITAKKKASQCQDDK